MRKPIFCEIVTENNGRVERGAWREMYVYAGGRIAVTLDNHHIKADKKEGTPDIDRTWVGVAGNVGTYNAPPSINLFKVENGKIIVDFDVFRERVERWNAEIEQGRVS